MVVARGLAAAASVTSSEGLPEVLVWTEGMVAAMGIEMGRREKVRL